ncbi:hypothetical protein Tco_0786932 [Tanacetum coccineum]
MEVFIGGLPRSIEGNVTDSKPQTLEEAITITQRLMDQVTKHNSVQGTNDHKRKFDDRRTSNNNNYQNNNNNNRNNDHHQQQNRRQETFKAYAVIPMKTCQLATRWVIRPELHEETIGKLGATAASLQCLVTCHACGEKGLQKSVLKSKQQCPWKSILAEETRRKVSKLRRSLMYVLSKNQHLARVLFDSGADKSFVSISLASMLNIPPITLDTTYDIEMADGNLVGTNTVI